MACASPRGHHGWIPAHCACSLVRAPATGTGADALFACPEFAASVYSITSLECTGFTAPFRTLPGGRAVCGWYILLAVISHLLLLACGCDPCCSPCRMSILEAEVYEACSNERRNCALC